MNFFKPIDKVKKFERISEAQEGMDEWKKRELEQQLLIPDPLKPYGGPLPKYKSAIDKRVVRIVFPTEEDMAAAGAVLHIAESSKGVKYITDLSMLIAFCHKMMDPSFAEQFKQVKEVKANVVIEDIEEIEEDLIDEEGENCESQECI